MLARLLAIVDSALNATFLAQRVKPTWNLDPQLALATERLCLFFIQLQFRF